jgi:hypothetical protein
VALLARATHSTCHPTVCNRACNSCNRACNSCNRASNNRALARATYTTCHPTHSLLAPSKHSALVLYPPVNSAYQTYTTYQSPEYGLDPNEQKKKATVPRHTKKSVNHEAYSIYQPTESALAISNHKQTKKKLDTLSIRQQSQTLTQLRGGEKPATRAPL